MDGNAESQQYLIHFRSLSLLTRSQYTCFSFPSSCVVTIKNHKRSHREWKRVLGEGDAEVARERRRLSLLAR